MSSQTTSDKLDKAIITLIRLTGACRTKGISKSQIEDGLQGVICDLEEIKNEKN